MISILMDVNSISYVEAAMLLLSHYGDIAGSADVLADASDRYGQKEIEDLLLELADINTASRPEIKALKARLSLAQLNIEKTNVKENN